MSTSGSKSNEHVAHFLVDIHTNGPVEALNRIVKDMKRNARGYKNFNHLRNRFLYSQRANASILGTPKPLDEVLNETGIKRGSYTKPSSNE